MANPQPDQFTRLSNELLEKIVEFDFSKRQYKVILAVARRTYGYQKKTEWISNSQLVEATNLAPGHVRAVVIELVELRVLDRTGSHSKQVLGIQKDYEQWGKRTETVRSERSGNVPKQYEVRTETVRKPYQNGAPQKKKEKRKTQSSIDPSKETARVFEMHGAAYLIEQYGQDEFREAVDAALARQVLQPIPWIAARLKGRASDATRRPSRNPSDPTFESVGARARRLADEKIRKLHDAPVAGDGGALRPPMDEPLGRIVEWPGLARRPA